MFLVKRAVSRPAISFCSSCQLRVQPLSQDSLLPVPTGRRVEKETWERGCYASLFAWNLRCFSFLSNKYVSQALWQTLQRTKLNFEKTTRLTSFETTIAIRFILFQVCLSILPFVFTVSFIPSFNVLSGGDLCSRQQFPPREDWILMNVITQLF